MDERFYKGIEEFNAGRFFEAHEVLEDLWHEYRETDRTFIQGLIQVSAGFYHFQCANWKGAASQLTKGIGKLVPYQPEHQGIGVSDFLNLIKPCLQTAADLKTAKTTDSKSIKIPHIKIGEIKVTQNLATTNQI